MDRSEAIALLNGGEEGIAKWNSEIDHWEKIPDLSGANLSHTNLSKAFLSGAKLIGANLMMSNLTGACLRGADLTHANLRGTDLCGADLSHAKLIYANSSRGNNAFQSIFNRAIDMSYSERAHFGMQHSGIQTNVGETNLRGADLTSADLTRAELVLGNLEDADLKDATVVGANLTGAILANANLTGADFSHSKLSHANMESALCERTIFVGTDGLYGLFPAKTVEVRGAANATYSRPWDLLTWARIRATGSLPLFGVSYTGIILIWIWATSVDFLNRIHERLQQSALATEFEWFDKLPDVPLPKHMGFTLIALLLLAIGSTLYKLLCPEAIQESSESRYCLQLKQPLIAYRSLSSSRLVARWVTTICYLIGGPWVVYLLSKRIWEALRILL